MKPGDFVITPSWTYHDHGNETDGPMVWLDGLDMHMVNLFEASFREGGPSEDAMAPEKPELDSLYRYGHNLVPVEHAHRRPTSPIFSYPYDRTREALEAMRRAEDPSPWFGYKMRYINPLTGGDAIPTISTFMQLDPARDDDARLPRDRQHRVRRRRGYGDDADRRSELRLGAARHHRRPELGAVRAHRLAAATPCSSATPTAASRRCWGTGATRAVATGAARSAPVTVAAPGTRSELEVDGCTVRYLRGGAARRCSTSTAVRRSPVRGPWMERLAGDARPDRPRPPGWGASAIAGWLDNIHDLAYFYLDFHARARARTRPRRRPLARRLARCEIAVRSPQHRDADPGRAGRAARTGRAEVRRVSRHRTKRRRAPLTTIPRSPTGPRAAARRASARHPPAEPARARARRLAAAALRSAPAQVAAPHRRPDARSSGAPTIGSSRSRTVPSSHAASRGARGRHPGVRSRPQIEAVDAFVER